MSDQNDHIPATSNQDDTPVNKALRENLPDNFNDVDLGHQDQKGLLSPLGDPLGKALNKGLSPVGKLVGGTGDRMAAFTHQDQPKKGGEGYEKLGGKEQTGQNPLGL